MLLLKPARSPRRWFALPNVLPQHVMNAVTSYFGRATATPPRAMPCPDTVSVRSGFGVYGGGGLFPETRSGPVGPLRLASKRDDYLAAAVPPSS